MPHATMKMKPGVDIIETPTLSEVSYQTANLVRFIPDTKGLGLVQKLGGWENYYGEPIASKVRALKGWADLDGNNYLGIGSEQELGVLDENGVIINTTPQYYETEVAPDFTTTLGSSTVTVVDNDYSPSTVDYVYYYTPVAVGGITLYGSYKIITSTGTQYTFNSGQTALYGPTVSATSCTIASGNPAILTVGGTITGTFGAGMTITGSGIADGTVIAAQLTGTTGGAGTYSVTVDQTVASAITVTGNVPRSYAFSTQVGSSLVEVTFPNHNLAVGRAIYIAPSTEIGGVTLQGLYTVVSLGGLPSTNQEQFTQQMFCIAASGTATATVAPTYINNDLIKSYFFVAKGPAPLGSGYGVGGYGAGGYGTGLSPNGDFFATISTFNMTVTSVTSGNIVPGQRILTGPATGATILSQTSGTPNLDGVYVLDQSFTVSPAEAMTASIYSGGTEITAVDWTLDNYGQDLIACPKGGAIYYWQPDGQVTTAQIIGGQTPIVNEGMFVAMPERQIVAYGSSFNLAADPLNVRWCDAGDPTTWIATSTNQAGSYRIPSGSKIISGIQGPQQGLLWTDTDLWAMQYVGFPLVYGFNKIGTNCGAIAQKSVGTLNNVIYWMSQKQFYMMSGNGVTPLPCSVWDAIFQNLKQGVDANGNPYTDHIRCAVNSQFNEVMWFYPSASSDGENDSYVKYNTLMQCWDNGTLGRTAWIDQSVLGPPIAAGTDNWLYQHERGNDAPVNGVTLPMLSEMETGYFQIADGDNIVFIDQIWPDLKFDPYSSSQATQSATVNFTIYYTNYSSDAKTDAGFYTGATGNYPGGTKNSTVQSQTFSVTSTTEYISCRIRARFMAFSLHNPSGTAGTGTFWRLGAIKFRYQPDGRY